MRVFSACFWHESSSFSPLPTGWDNYREALLYRPLTGEGAEVWQRVRMLAPIAVCARERGHDVVEGLGVLANPSGPTVRSVYEQLRAELLADLVAAGAVDAVLLFLHGAQMAEGYDDCEGDILARIREIVGPKVFIGAVLDLHCNVTPEMTAAADALVPCKEYPHTDWPARSAQLVEIAEAAVAGQVRPRTVFHPAPMLGLYHTTRQPLRSLVDELTALEGADGVLAANLAHGFAQADQPHTGAGVLLVVDNPAPRHREMARTLAHRFFAMREEIATNHPSLEDALNQVEAHLADAPHGPVVMADTSDNPGGGAPGDATFVLRALLQRGIRGAALAALWDPGAVRIATTAGVGARLRMRIGGKLGELSGDPLDLDVTVTGLNPNASQASFAAGQRSPFGASAALETNGVQIIVTTQRQQVVGPDLFGELGIDPLAQRLLVVKSAQHFHANFAPIASHIIYARAPGYTDTDYSRLSFHKLTRPLWPLDATPFKAHGQTWN